MSACAPMMLRVRPPQFTTTTVSGERSDPAGQDETFYVRERYYGVFMRSWTLPAGIREDEISADFENGLLEITVKGGAADVPEPRRIEIKRRP